jgi:uncharacterized damage-inducible protein DinB
MNPSLVPLHAILALNTRLFRNCFIDVSDEMAGRIITERTNTMIFIALHCLDARVFIAEVAGVSLSHPFPEIASAARLADIESYPSLNELLRAWTEVSGGLSRALETVTEAALQAASPRRFPGSDGSRRGALSFLVQHESYHIGQLSLLRRIFGLASMSYAETSATL